MAVHELKILPKYFGPVARDEKRFEIRKNDRDYRLGDVLVLRETLGDTQDFLRGTILRAVTYVTDVDSPVCKSGFCVLSLWPIDGILFRQYEMQSVHGTRVMWLAAHHHIVKGDTVQLAGFAAPWVILRGFTTQTVEGLPKQATVGIVREATNATAA